MDSLTTQRRKFLLGTGYGLGATALSTLLNPELIGTANAAAGASNPGLPQFPNFAPKAKRIIYLFMAGGPSHIDTFDYKPEMRKFHGQELPESVRQGQRLTGMTSGQSTFPCVAPMFNFERFGQHGTWVNKDILPYTSGIVDDIMTRRSRTSTPAFNSKGNPRSVLGSVMAWAAKTITCPPTS